MAIKRFETEDKVGFIEVETSMSFGDKLKYKQALASDKVRYKGDEIIAELPKPEPRQHQDVKLLATAIKDWSKVDTNKKPVPVTVDNILNDRDLGDLFEEALDAILIQNKLRATTATNEEDEEKK